MNQPQHPPALPRPAPARAAAFLHARPIRRFSAPVRASASAPAFRLFDHTLIDRLRSPLTRLRD